MSPATYAVLLSGLGAALQRLESGQPALAQPIIQSAYDLLAAKQREEEMAFHENIQALAECRRRDEPIGELA